MKHFILNRTCYACPEQYDVFLNEEQVGYLRLRHGVFRCDYPACGGETLYYAYCDSDGIFSDEERNECIPKAIHAIANKLNIKDYDVEIHIDNINW